MFTSTIDGSDIASVDVIIHQLGKPTSIVVSSGIQINNIYQAQANIDISSSAGCACLAQGQSAPNTHFDYQFRVTNSDGGTSFGPVAQSVVEDTRFEWQTLTKGDVVIHWYSGDQAFANSAADSANAAIDKASQALGVTIDQPFDMFVYDTEEAMRSAVNPGRENVQAEAHPDIDTIFAWLPSNQPADPYNQTVIAHELTHLVFHHAVDNPYHGVPRWLDEGVAVYESEGYTTQWQSYVNVAVGNKALIPLDGLAGLFPSVTSEFYLAYGESVAAVDYFVRTYGEPKLWELVNSYAAGVSDDEAFTAATGSDVAAFNAAWFSSYNLTPPAPAGPQQGAPGPVPSDWTSTGGAPATLSPQTGPTETPPPSGAPRETARPVSSGGATEPGVPRLDRSAAETAAAAVAAPTWSRSCLLFGLVAGLDRCHDRGGDRAAQQICRAAGPQLVLSAVAGAPVDFRIGDRITLAKAHPCGSTGWQVVRIGADIGLVCEGCQHRVLIERRQLERRLKGFVERGSAE